MSQIHNGIFATFAVLTSLGAAQLASGHDLSGFRQAVSVAPEAGVNRAGKSDRAATKVAPGQARTISVVPDGLNDTSVLVRVPVAREETRNRPVAPLKPSATKTAVACEPPVSVLSEVAKLLEPGRCVT
ncbi:MAG: hypothetical protein PS018_04335 [bacterium]|nr:hypothetical protein [bacterium]